MSKCIKGGGPLILGMGDNPSSKELVEVRKTLKKKSLKRKKSLKKNKTQRKKK